VAPFIRELSNAVVERGKSLARRAAKTSLSCFVMRAIARFVQDQQQGAVKFEWPPRWRGRRRLSRWRICIRLRLRVPRPATLLWPVLYFTSRFGWPQHEPPASFGAKSCPKGRRRLKFCGAHRASFFFNFSYLPPRQLRDRHEGPSDAMQLRPRPL
jgi:hypothetical protein